MINEKIDKCAGLILYFNNDHMRDTHTLPFFVLIVVYLCLRKMIFDKNMHLHLFKRVSTKHKQKTISQFIETSDCKHSIVSLSVISDRTKSANLNLEGLNLDQSI